MMTLAKLKTSLLAFATVGSLGLATVAVPRSIGAAGQEPSNIPAPPTAATRPIKPPTEREKAAGRDGGENEPVVDVRELHSGSSAPSDSTVQIRVEGKRPVMDQDGEIQMPMER